jgi:hypothetical protein
VHPLEVYPLDGNETLVFPNWVMFNRAKNDEDPVHQVFLQEWSELTGSNKCLIGYNVLGEGYFDQYPALEGDLDEAGPGIVVDHVEGGEVMDLEVDDPE